MSEVLPVTEVIAQPACAELAQQDVSLVIKPAKA